MNENITGTKNVHTPAEPAVLNDPLRNRGVAFTPAGADCVPERLGSLPDGLTSCDRAGRAERRNCRQFTR